MNYFFECTNCIVLLNMNLAVCYDQNSLIVLSPTGLYVIHQTLHRHFDGQTSKIDYLFNLRWLSVT